MYLRNEKVLLESARRKCHFWNRLVELITTIYLVILQCCALITFQNYFHGLKRQKIGGLGS